MKRVTIVLLAIIVGLTMSLTALAQDDTKTKTIPFIEDILGQLDFIEGRILVLQGAMAGKEGWRPMEGVRSVGETYLHIAFGNYALPMLMGFEPPAELNFKLDPKAWDAQPADQANVTKVLKASFVNIRGVAKKLTAAQLEERMDFFGTEMTKRNALISALNHLHEHFGQSIAYARMNGVVPPWTATEHAAEQAKKGTEGK